MKKQPITPGQTAKMLPKSLGEDSYKLPDGDDLSQRTTPIGSEYKNLDRNQTRGRVRNAELHDQYHTQPLVVGEGSHKLSAYELPVCETDKERRSFPGWCVQQLDGAEMDAVSMEGTTETRGGKKTNKSHANAAGEMQRRFQ